MPALLKVLSSHSHRSYDPTSVPAHALRCQFQTFGEEGVKPNFSLCRAMIPKKDQHCSKDCCPGDSVTG